MVGIFVDTAIVVPKQPGSSYKKPHLGIDSGKWEMILVIDIIVLIGKNETNQEDSSVEQLKYHSKTVHWMQQ